MSQSKGSFLSKMGALASRALSWLPLLGILSKAALPKQSSTIDEVLGTIGAVEQVAEAFKTSPDQKLGPQKLQAAKPAIEELIKNSQLLAGAKIADQAGFDSSVDQVISGFVGILNSVEHHK